MKKILLLLCIAALGCEKPEPTCVTCFIDGDEAFTGCIEDYPWVEDIYEVRESLDPLFVNEECHYHN